ncbi:MAG: hypothetical protein ACTSVI_02415, partial [Promethearchaeota archaeon]
PAKPKHNINPIKHACVEFSNVLGIPINANLIRRISNDKKIYESYREINDYNKKVLVIDDIYTQGKTKNAIFQALMHLGSPKMGIITICKTDYNDYYHQR